MQAAAPGYPAESGPPTRPLDAVMRRHMEACLHGDFSRVRVHTGPEAAAAAAAMNARAYTVGTDIVFGHGEYAPATVAGQHLLAHELAHVVQQASGVSPTGVAQLAPRDAPGTIGNVQDQPRSVQRQRGLETAIHALWQFNAFQNAFQAKAERWTQAALLVSNAYRAAAQKYTAAIEEDKQAEARTAAIWMAIIPVLLNASLAFMLQPQDTVLPLLTEEKDRALKGSVPEESKPSLPGLAPSGAGPAMSQDDVYLARPEQAQILGGLLPGKAAPTSSTISAPPAIPPFLSPAPPPPIITQPGAASMASSAAVGVTATALRSVPAPTISVAAPDPQTFQNEVAGKIAQATADALETFSRIAGELQELSPEQWAQFSLTGQQLMYDSWLRRAKGFAVPGQLPEQGRLEDEFERGLWAKYWQQQRVTQIRFALTMRYPTVGSAMKKRLRELGIDKEAGLRLSGFTWFAKGHLFEDYDTDDAEALMTWGSSYKPR